MFLIFKDAVVGEMRISVNAISFYYSRGDSVLITTNTGTTFRAKDYTVADLDAALSESYIAIKRVSRINNVSNDL